MMAIHYGLVAALIAVVVITGATIIHDQLHPKPVTQTWDGATCQMNGKTWPARVDRIVPGEVDFQCRLQDMP